MKETYYIKSGEEITGPFEDWEILNLYQTGQIQKDDRMSTYKRYNTWEKCEAIEDYEEILDELRREIQKPQAIRWMDIEKELQKIREEAQKTKWACRSVAIGLLVIIFFGIKLTIK